MRPHPSAGALGRLLLFVTAALAIVPVLMAPLASAATFGGASPDATHVFFSTADALIDSDTDGVTDVYERTGTTTSLISLGDLTPNPASGANFVRVSSDGSRMWFTTVDRLVAADTDPYQDIYERSGGTTTLVSTSSYSGGGAGAAFFEGASSDGSRVFFQTTERLSVFDTDNQTDIYERSGGTTTLVSIGSNSSDPNIGPVGFDGASADGTHVWFTTAESLVPEDTDTMPDLYERSGGTTSLVSIGGNGTFPVQFHGASSDGGHVFFRTDEQLVAGDTDTTTDIYERSGGVTTRVSAGEINGNGNAQALFTGVSTDGLRVFFTTSEQLTSADTDSSIDLYERAGGVTTLVSAGAINGNGAFAVGGQFASADGTHVFFTTAEQLTGADTDSSTDIYERTGGVTTLVSAGAINGNGAFAAQPVYVSPDGSRVYFTTSEQLSSADTDTVSDLYLRQGGTTTLVSVTRPGSFGAGAAFFGAESADGSRVIFSSDDTNWAGAATGRVVFERAGGTTRLVSGVVNQIAGLVDASDDLSRIFFFTAQPLFPDDPEFVGDYFQRLDGTTTLASTGPADDHSANSPSASRVSSDGTHLVFNTVQSLVSADTDGRADVYDRSGSTTTLVSAGEVNGNGAFDALVRGMSADGSHIFFATNEALVPGDNNGTEDLYQVAGGVTSRVTTVPANVLAISPDGARVQFWAVEQLAANDHDTVVDIYEVENGITKLISQGTLGNTTNLVPTLGTMTPTGAIFTTSEQLEPDDLDNSVDLYERSGNTTTVVSKGAINGNGAFDASYEGASTDASRIFFETSEQLVAADTDTVADVYERSGGQTTLISVGPSGNATQPAHFAGATPDGTHVFFTTNDALTNDDLDSASDIYERAGGTTTLMSSGVDGGGNANTAVSFGGVTPDGAHVFFNTSEPLVPADQNSSSDVYEHAAGQTTLVSARQGDHLAGGGSNFSKASLDGSKVLFQTGERLVNTDHDDLIDLYERDGSNTFLVSTAQTQTFPAAPDLNSLDPASPANVTFLSVRGSAPGGTTVKVYDNAGCNGAPVATGSAADFASPGLVVHPDQDATTTFHATATDADGYASPCSSSSLTFVEDSTAPPTPTVAGTTPASPANDNDPQVTGAAEGGSTVRLYSTADCTGSPLATGPAADFAAPGLTIVVLDDSTTSLRATATDAAGNTSGCSGAVSYVEDTPDVAPVFEQPSQLTPPTLTPTGGSAGGTGTTPPDTTAPDTKIAAGPKPRITSRTATFRFTATEAGATFRCRLDKQRFSACRSPKTYKGLKLGKHTFYVVAVDAAGNADATPATRAFRVLKKR